MKKFEYHVAIVNEDGTFNYITKTEGTMFFCEKGKPAARFSQTKAEDILIGMTLNMIPGAIIQTLAECVSFTNGESEDEAM